MFAFKSCSIQKMLNRGTVLNRNLNGLASNRNYEQSEWPGAKFYNDTYGKRVNAIKSIFLRNCIKNDHGQSDISNNTEECFEHLSE